MKVTEFDYELPEELIAQTPIKKRDESRLMVLNRKEQTIEHKIFKDIIDYLKPGDVLVRNNTKVIPARLFGKKETGAKVEFLLLNNIEGDIDIKLFELGNESEDKKILSISNEEMKEFLKMLVKIGLNIYANYK